MVIQFTFPGQKLLIACFASAHRRTFFSSLILFPSGLLILDRKAYAAGHLGRTSTATDGNKKTHLLALELDVLWNLDIGDPDYKHVSVDLNSAKLAAVTVAAVRTWPVKLMQPTPFHVQQSNLASQEDNTLEEPLRDCLKIKSDWFSISGQRIQLLSLKDMKKRAENKAAWIVWCVCVVVLPGTILRDAGREDISDAAGVTYVDRQVQAPPCVSPEETNFSSNLSGGGRWIKKGGAGTGPASGLRRASAVTSPLAANRDAGDSGRTSAARRRSRHRRASVVPRQPISSASSRRYPQIRSPLAVRLIELICGGAAPASSSTGGANEAKQRWPRGSCKAGKEVQ
ncbi:lectin protein kinase family protein [Striga asiatica]|uniref:Lectin protein kinase family protein n=1 Tax=Striga asiatica TaxID=4170 RepID=A0A5A7QMW9_STRAF|nr:lectin protein kinase family protein [Striga asiatica]